MNYKKIVLNIAVFLQFVSFVKAQDSIYSILTELCSTHAYDAFNILNQIEKSKFSQKSTVNFDICKKLFVINNSGYSLHKELFSKLVTYSGKPVSMKLLVTPGFHASVIKKRQQCIGWLESKDQERKLLKLYLSQIREHEPYLMNLWNVHDKYWQQDLSSFCMPQMLSQYDTNPTALGSYQWLKRLNLMAMPITSSATGGAMQGVTDSIRRSESLIKGAFRGGINAIKDLGTQYKTLLNPTAFKAGLKACQDETNSKIWGGLLWYLSVSGLISLPYLTYKNDKNLLKMTEHFRKEIKHQVQNINDLLVITRNLYKYILKTPLMLYITGLAEIGELFENKEIVKFLEFSRIILNNESKVLDKGYLFAAYNLVKSIKQQLIPLMEFIGEIDTYVCLAELINSHKNNKFRPFSLVQILADPKATQMELVGFHNPLVQNNKSVNNLSMNGPDSHVLLEGPHACGKSTITRAITYNFILIHSFGIISSIKGKSSIFDRFIAYSNVSENPQLGLSGFDAQLHEMITMRATIDNYEKDNKKVFCFLDEPLTGTMEEAGAKELKDFCSYISSKNNVLCVLATHFNNISSKDIFKPHYMECDETKPGEFVRTYILKPGKHPWWYSEKDKRKRYIDWMIDSAKKHLIFI